MLASTLILVVAAASGDVLRVDDDAPPGGDGLTWETAYRHLQDALVAAGPGVEIRVGGGVYLPDRSEEEPDGTGDRAATFTLIEGVALRGGYRGLAAEKGEDPDERDLELFETVLSGDLLGDDEPEFRFRDDNSVHVVTATALTAGTVVDGLTVSSGFADGSGSDGRGAGVLVDRGAPVFTRCTFRESLAERVGGGICADDASPSFLDCAFEGNRAAVGGIPRTSGGGAACFEGAPLFFQCRFAGNTAEFRGAGLYLTNCDGARVDSCVFESNHSQGPVSNNASSSGGLALQLSEGEVVDCRFIANSALGGDRGGAGGAVAVSGDAIIGGLVRIRRCVFEGNVATAGGAVVSSDSTALFEDCTFASNTARLGPAGFGVGGVVFSNFRSQAVFRRCRFEDNEAEAEGGAVYNDFECTPVFEDCTFERNVAGTSGGAIHSAAGRSNLAAASGSTFCDNVPNHVTGPFEDRGGNTFCPLCDGDVDGNGVVTFDDLLALLNAWGPCPEEGPCPADFDENDAVDFEDLLRVLAAWGPC